MKKARTTNPRGEIEELDIVRPSTDGTMSEMVGREVHVALFKERLASIEGLEGRVARRFFADDWSKFEDALKQVDWVWNRYDDAKGRAEGQRKSAPAHELYDKLVDVDLARAVGTWNKYAPRERQIDLQDIIKKKGLKQQVEKLNSKAMSEMIDSVEDALDNWGNPKLEKRGPSEYVWGVRLDDRHGGYYTYKGNSSQLSVLFVLRPQHKFGKALFMAYPKLGTANLTKARSSSLVDGRFDAKLEYSGEISLPSIGRGIVRREVDKAVAETLKYFQQDYVNKGVVTRGFG